MSDDTRQARIEAAMTALFQGERGDVALGYYTIRSRMDAALDAADAIGRERVSVAEAEAMLERYFMNRFEAIMADGQHLAIGFLEQSHAEEARIIALLTAQPEPGAEGETE